jgi:HEAT repeat protein
VLALGRSRDARAVPTLIDVLDDPEVAAHAASALGQLKAFAARPALERLLTDPQPLVRREARKALKKLA